MPLVQLYDTTTAAGMTAILSILTTTIWCLSLVVGSTLLPLVIACASCCLYFWMGIWRSSIYFLLATLECLYPWLIHNSISILINGSSPILLSFLASIRALFCSSSTFHPALIYLRNGCLAIYLTLEEPWAQSMPQLYFYVLYVT